MGRHLWDVYLFGAINGSPCQPELLTRQALAKFSRTCHIVSPLHSSLDSSTVPHQAQAPLRRGSMLPTVEKPVGQAGQEVTSSQMVFTAAL